MPQAADILTLPVPKHTFNAEVFDDAKVLAKYDMGRVYFGMCLKILQMSPEAMKKKVFAMEGLEATKANITQRLINDFEGCAEDLVLLAEMFSTAAARLTAVHRRLI